MAKQARIQLQDIILWEDEEYFALNKPPFISTLQDRADEVNLLDLAKPYLEDAQADPARRPQTVAHALDVLMHSMFRVCLPAAAGS